MCRQGVETYTAEDITNDLLVGAGLETFSERPARKAILHIHLDHPSKQLRRMVTDLDGIPTGHIAWYRGKRWKVADAKVIDTTHHHGHQKDKGFACDYYLEEVV